MKLSTSTQSNHRKKTPYRSHLSEVRSLSLFLQVAAFYLSDFLPCKDRGFVCKEGDFVYLCVKFICKVKGKYIAIDLMANENKWTELPDHLLDVIFDMLFDSLYDLARFGSVCDSWRSVYLWNLSQLQLPKFPLLMINNPQTHIEGEEKTKENDKQVQQDKKYEERRSVYSLTTKCVQKFQLQVPHNRFCFGSSHGWLVTVAMDKKNIYPVALLNPFLSPVHNNEIQLPSLQMLPPDPIYDIVDYWFYLHKAVVSTNPTTDADYTVMVIYGQYTELAFWKPGNTRWNALQTEWSTLDDLMFHGHLFFSVNCSGVVMACDVSDSEHQKFRKIESELPGSTSWAKKYVVESLGYLYQVHRLVFDDGDNPPHRTIGFQVFKMDCEIEKWEEEEGLEPKWIEVSSLDDRAFFLGHNNSMSRSAAGLPGVKSNCIYFTDDYFGGYIIEDDDESTGPSDLGIFCMEDKSFERHYYPSSEHLPIWPAPIWVEPWKQQ